MNTQPSLWLAGEIAKLFHCPSFDVDLHGVSIDSRSIQPGDLFIALTGDPGPRFGGGEPGARDGHDFVAMAIERGAAAVMVHQDVKSAVPVIRVENTLDGLWQLGAAARARFSGHVVAITGSSGKTTMRGWLESLLGRVGTTHGSVGSFNNHWGVPLSLARMPADADFGIFEVGTNSPGEIAPLSELIAPDVALLLNVLPAHIGNFSGMGALRQEKLSIQHGLKPGGTFVLPLALSAQVDDPGTLSFGLDPVADVSAKTQEVDEGTKLDASVAGLPMQITIPWAGHERAESALAALAVLYALHVDATSVANCFSELDLPEGRGNYEEIGGILIINDSYNANPASMKMALRNLQGMKTTGRKIALLGEMLELGDESETAHKEIASLTSALDEVVTFGDGFQQVEFDGAHRHLGTVEEFDLPIFVDGIFKGDTVLVKGSNRVFWKKGFVALLASALDQ